MLMSRFAAKSTDKPLPELSSRSAKVLSLLLILEALRQEPVPMRPQKV